MARVVRISNVARGRQHSRRLIDPEKMVLYKDYPLAASTPRGSIAHRSLGRGTRLLLFASRSGFGFGLGLGLGF